MSRLTRAFFNTLNRVLHDQSGTWGAIGGAAITSAVGVGSQMMSQGERKGAGVGMTPTQVVTMPTFPWSAPTLKTSADFIRKSMDDMQQGNLPQWWGRMQQPIQQGMQRSARQAYFGSPGLSGGSIMDQVRSGSAALGTGSGVGAARENKVLSDYANKMKQIDEYMATQSLAYGQEAAKTLPYQAAMQPQGPPAQIVGGQPYNMPADPDPWGEAFGGIASALPWLTGGFGAQNTTTDWMHTDPTVGRQGPPPGQSYDEYMYNQSLANQANRYSNQINWEPYPLRSGEYY